MSSGLDIPRIFNIVGATSARIPSSIFLYLLLTSINGTGLSEWAVRTPNEVYRLVEKGATNRATAETKLNDVSSRSHAIFQIIIE